MQLTKLTHLLIGTILIDIFFPYPTLAIDFSKCDYANFSQTAIELFSVGNYKDALKFFDKAVLAAPNKAEGYLNRGAVFGILNQHDKAIKDEWHAVSLSSDNSAESIRIKSIAHENLSGIYLDMRRFKEAISEAKIAIELCPREASTHETMGNVLSKIGKGAKAIESYEKAKELYEEESAQGMDIVNKYINELTRKILEIQRKLHPNEKSYEKSAKFLPEPKVEY